MDGYEAKQIIEWLKGQFDEDGRVAGIAQYAADATALLEQIARGASAWTTLSREEMQKMARDFLAGKARE